MPLRDGGKRSLKSHKLAARRSAEQPGQIQCSDPTDGSEAPANNHSAIRLDGHCLDTPIHPESGVEGSIELAIRIQPRDTTPADAVKNHRRATDQDLDTIERAIQALNQIPPQVHIKARFIEVEQDDNKALGFDWYLGQFGNSVVASGGSAPSLNVPVSSANPLGTFPGNTTASQIAGAASDQLVTSGLRNTGPAIGTITGIMTDPNFRVVIHALENRSGFEQLAEPEVVTTSGRQTQMRATDIKTIVTGYSFQNGGGGTATVGTTTTAN